MHSQNRALKAQSSAKKAETKQNERQTSSQDSNISVLANWKSKYLQA